MIDAEIRTYDLSKKLKEITPKIRSKLKTVLGITSKEWQSHVKQRYFTNYKYGKRSEKLQNRTTFLSKSIRPAPLKETQGALERGLTFGASYAPVHVGPKGKTTTITPKNVNWLTIPLEAALTPRGEARGKAGDENQWGKTFIQKSQKGNLIIFGQRVFQKGARAGQTSGDIIPLFVLKKQVTVKTRIHPKEIIDWGKDKFIDNIEKDVLGAV